jgi:hypothetical protein
VIEIVERVTRYGRLEGGRVETWVVRRRKKSRNGVPVWRSEEGPRKEITASTSATSGKRFSVTDGAVSSPVMICG